MQKNWRQVKTRHTPKTWRKVKTWRMPETCRMPKTCRMVKTWRIQNIRRMVKTWRMPKTLRMVKTWRIQNIRQMLKTWRLGKYWRPWKCWRSRKSRRPTEELPYCLGSAEYSTADFSLDPLMSTFSSLLMLNHVHVVSKWRMVLQCSAFMGGISSCTVPAVCTSLPCSKWSNLWRRPNTWRLPEILLFSAKP